MKSHRVWVRLIGILLLLMGGALAGARLVKASESRMGYWFIETLTVGEAELPAGVAIRASDPAVQPRGYLILENPTETLLYVLSLSYKNVLVMETPDPNWKTRVNGAHEVASYLVAPNRPAYLSMKALTDLDRNLADRNVLTFAPPPAGASIPDAQRSELLLVYGEQVIEVPFTVTYALNIDFGNGSQAYLDEMANTQATDDANATATQQAEAPAARAAWNNTLVIGLAGLAGLLVIGWLVWRGLALRK